MDARDKKAETHLRGRRLTFVTTTVLVVLNSCHLEATPQTSFPCQPEDPWTDSTRTSSSVRQVSTRQRTCQRRVRILWTLFEMREGRQNGAVLKGKERAPL
ncbi:hypothetical protein TNCT_406251 [Trichonephila clavata]|uniref:Uncharacterized protein n=1 Tax=Trichonephila clavata TaxID=2740835 RepID=A0A8X6FCB0_TRICU|nr:hypothetical protein TNCT_406251 [Trichonephila clavata]